MLVRTGALGLKRPLKHPAKACIQSAEDAVSSSPMHVTVAITALLCMLGPEAEELLLLALPCCWLLR